MKSKLKFIIPIAFLLLGAGGYKFVFAKPKKKEPKPHIDGSVYMLGKEFLVNLHDGRFAKLTVGLVLDPHDKSTLPAGGGGHGAAPPKPPEGFGAMNQEGAVRDIITDELTGAKDTELIESKGREKLKEHILERIHKKTDVHATSVLFTDVTVQ